MHYDKFPQEFPDLVASGLPVTREDAVVIVRQKLDAELKKVTEGIKRTEEAVKRRLEQVRLDEQEGKEVPGNIKLLRIAIRQKANYEAQEIGLKVLTAIPEGEKESPIVVQLLKEIFPVWSMDEGFINAIVKGFESESRYIQPQDDTKTSDGLRNETKISEKEDQQGKSSNAVKDFLSFVPVWRINKQTGDWYNSTKESFNLNNFVPFKFAFSKTLDWFTNYIELFKPTTEYLNKTIAFIRSEETATEYSESLIRALEDLFSKSSIYPNASKHFTVRMYQHPITKSLYYTAFISKSNQDISNISTSTLMQRQHDRNSPWHSIVISANDALEGLITKLEESTIMERIYSKVVAIDSSVSREEFSNVYEYYKALDTLNEMHNHLGSLDSRDYYIAIGEWFRGKFSAKYVSASGTDVKTDIKNQILSALVTAVQSGILRRDNKIQISDPKKLYEFLVTLKLDHLIKSTGFKKSDLDIISSRFDSIRSHIPNITKSDSAEAIEVKMENWVSNNSTYLSDIARIFLKEDATAPSHSLIDASGNRINKASVSSFGIKLINLLHSVPIAYHPQLKEERT